jgi:hypothetical protein
MRFSVILVGLLVALAVVVSGCGGGGSTGGSSEGPASSSSTSDSTGEGTEASSTESSSEEGSTDGEESSDGGSEGKALTKAEMLKTGEEICKGIPNNYGVGLKNLEKELGKKPSQKQATEKAAIPPIYSAVEEFEALTPPSGEEAEVEAIIAALEAAAKGLEAKPESELVGPKSPFNEFQKLSQKYGLSTCASL